MSHEPKSTSGAASRVLVAGIGNIFFGDDGFGVAVARALAARALPDGVSVRDFGIRGLDLGYALTDGYEAAILVDTVQRGGLPGTLYVIDVLAAETDTVATTGFSPHGMGPAQVIEWARSVGEPCRHVILVGCEPGSFGTEEGGEGRMGLSAPVSAAVPEALTHIEAFAARIVERTREGEPHVA